MADSAQWQPRLPSLERLRGLRPLQQLALLGLAATLLGALLYLFAWRPLAATIGELERANHAAAALLVRVEQLAAEFRAQAAVLPPAAAASLPQLVDATAHALPVARLQPGRGGGRLWLEAVAFEDLLRWLDRLEREYAVVILALTVTPAAAPGAVNVEVELALPGPAGDTSTR